MLGNTIVRAAFGGLLAALMLTPRITWGAACKQACKDEIAACVSADCQTLPTRGAKQHCKRNCAKTLVKDCYADLTVCGATSARPAKPSGPPRRPAAAGSPELRRVAGAPRARRPGIGRRVWGATRYVGAPRSCR